MSISVNCGLHELHELPKRIEDYVNKYRMDEGQENEFIGLIRLICHSVRFVCTCAINMCKSIKKLLRIIENGREMVD